MLYDKNGVSHGSAIHKRRLVPRVIVDRELGWDIRGDFALYGVRRKSGLRASAIDPSLWCISLHANTQLSGKCNVHAKMDGRASECFFTRPDIIRMTLKTAELQVDTHL